MANNLPAAEQRQATGEFTSTQGALADGGTLSASLQDFARASAQVFPAPEGDTAEVPYAQIASTFGQMQSRSLQQSQGRFVATITTDNGEASFAGFETAPAFQASIGWFGPQIHAVHQTGLVERLNMTLYATANAMDLSKFTSPNIPERIQSILQALVRRWLSVGYPAITSDKDRRVASALHELNTEPLQILDRILSDSDDHTIDGLDELTKAVPMVHNSVNVWILRQLCGTGAAWPSFLELAQDFGMLYTPTLGGAQENGRLFSVKVAFETASTKEVDATSLQGALVSPTVPYTHVLVPAMPTSGLHRAYTGTTDLAPGQMVRSTVRYPADQHDGRAYILNPPPYLMSVFQSLSRPATMGNTLIPGQMRAGLEQLNQATQKQLDAVRKFMTGLARSALHAVQLQGSTASIAVALDPGWEVGRAYEITLNETPLFRGLLASVSHSISSSARGPQAGTGLAFSHVQWGSFTLPFN